MADCAPPATAKLPISNQLQPLSRVKDYRVVLQTCQGDSGKRLAVRAMNIDGDDLLLTVDPQSLATKLERKDLLEMRRYDAAPAGWDAVP